MPLDMSYVRQQAENIQHEKESSGNRDIKQYDWKVGQNRGRFLPPWPGSGELAMHVWHHFKLPKPFSHTWCYENMYPGRGIQCPICAAIRAIKSRGIDCWQQAAVDMPKTNWIDRMPVLKDAYGRVSSITSWDQHPGVQVIDLRTQTFNYFIGMASQTNLDLTSIGDGYDVMINFVDGKQKDFGIFPGVPNPLGPTAEITKQWASQLYDIRAFNKLPDWNSQDGKVKWEKLCQAAKSLEQSYLAGSGAVAPGAPPVGQFPSSMPPGPGQQPSFTAPSYAPAPQAPPPQQFVNPAALSGDVPFAAPPMSPPPAQAPAMPPPAPPQALPPMDASAPPQQSYTPPPAPPQALPPMTTAPDNRPPWEASAPTLTPPPMQYQPPTASAPPPSMTSTSADGKPVCFAHSRLDKSVVYGLTGSAPVAGGWSDDPQEVGYRCKMCPLELDCESKSKAAFPNDYVKDATGAYPKPPASQFPN